MNSRALGGFVKGRSQVATARVGTFGLFAALGLALVLASLAFVRPAKEPVAVHIPAQTVGPEGVAELFVATWLAASPGDSLAPYYPGTATAALRPQYAPVPPPAPKVLRTATIRADELADNYWSVTVGAMTQAGDAPVATRFFRVPMMLTRVKLYVASALPSEVAGPLGSKSPDLAVGSLGRPNPADPVAVSVAQFLAALLTGQGELTRYTSADTTVAPINPIPFAAVELTDLATRKLNGDINHLEVVAAATAMDANGHPTGLSFPLEMSLRNSRWEVIRVLLAPSLSGSQPDLTPATPLASIATTSSTSSTTTPSSSTTTVPPSTTTTRRST